MSAHDNRRMNEPDLDTLQGAVRLTDWGVIRAQGADAASFLQGQLTQDVQQLDRGRARLAGYCSRQGPPARQLAGLARAARTNCCWRAAPTCCRPR